MHRPACPAPPCDSALPPLPARVTITPPPTFDYFGIACLMARGAASRVRIADEGEEPAS